MLDNRSTARSPSLLAYYLRVCRDRADKSRARVAELGNLSASVVEKWELNGHLPSFDLLARWYIAVEPPRIYWEKIIDLTVRAMIPDYAEDVPEQIRLDDIDLWHLSVLPYPACYHSTALYDVVAANNAFYQQFQGLKYLDTMVDGPPNLLVWQMRHPCARLLVQRWYERTHVLLTKFRIQAPGTAPADRIDQIKAACSKAPEFDAMWDSDPEPGLLDDLNLTMLGSDEKWHTYETRTHLADRSPYLSLYSVLPTDGLGTDPPHQLFS